MNVFDVIGPVMVGPSSSHTAGAVRIGAIAREILGDSPVNAVITFYGSFARTGRGHGTDRAIVGGLMGMATDSPDIKRSLDKAAAEGLNIQFRLSEKKCGHPNAALIEADGKNGGHISILGYSVGGGNVLIKRLNGVDVEFSGQYNTLIVPHYDQPGTIAAVTGIFAREGINIAFMRVYRSGQRGESIMIIETDQPLPRQLADEISTLNSVRQAKIVYALPSC